MNLDNITLALLIVQVFTLGVISGVALCLRIIAKKK